MPSFSKRNDPTLPLRFERRRKPFMRSHGFGRCGAAESVAELAFALGEERGPHLLDNIWKAGLEDSSRHGLEGHAADAEIGLLPPLLFAILEQPKGLRMFRAETYAAFGPQDFDQPRVRFARGQAFH